MHTVMVWRGPKGAYSGGMEGARGCIQWWYGGGQRVHTVVVWRGPKGAYSDGMEGAKGCIQ